MKNIITATREHLQRLYPHCRDVDIHVQRDADGSFISKIHLRAKRKILHAMKRDSSVRRSLDRSYQAIRKQMEKVGG